jgi:Sulfite exporter TauE/SafE.
MNIIWGIIASVFSGICASMGLGGGFVLMIYLTVIAGTDAKSAGGINLIFFLIVGTMSLFLHKSSSLIEKPPLVPMIVLGILGAGAGLALGAFLDGKLLSKIFGGFVIIAGLMQVFGKKREIKKTSCG